MSVTAGRTSLPWLLAFVVLSSAYPLTYAGLRVAKVLVHTAFFVSEEGFNAHHVHDLESTHPALLGVFGPLAAAELAVHRWLKP